MLKTIQITGFNSMYIYDRYIIEKFYNKDKDKLISPRLQHMTDEEKSYIENRFDEFKAWIKI